MELSRLQGVVETCSVSDVTTVLAEVEAAADRGWWAAGFVAYEAAPAFDRALTVRPRTSGPVGARLPLAWFALFAEAHVTKPLWRDRPRVVVPGGDAISERSDWTSELTRAQHHEAVGTIRAAIADGDTYLANLTSRFRRPWRPEEQAVDLYRPLDSGHAGGLHALLETEEWAVACGSPELFFDLRADRLITRPMKGTAPRGRWADEDRQLAEALQSSPKERAENVMVVDMLRNDLGRLAVPGTIQVPELCRLERHPTVWQLTSTVAATVRPGAGLVEVFSALFPCASVTGAPKVSTMRILSTLERSERGVYCGAIGMVRPSTGGRGPGARFAVAIRTAVVDKSGGLAEYGSGGGVTWDSTPDDEWEELLVKTRVVTSPVVPLESAPALLETMGFDPTSRNTPGGPNPRDAGSLASTGIRNLRRHLDRLTGSAELLGYALPDDLEPRLSAAVSTCQQRARVRLLVAIDGTVTIDVHPMDDPPPPGASLSLCVGDPSVDPSDRRLFHKTTDRRRYDEQRRRHPGADDVVLVNLRGEVTETTRANLVVRLGGRWYTPPLACGLLPGVERGRLLGEGVVTERVIAVEELLEADGVATVSSLRGWLDAEVRTDDRR